MESATHKYRTNYWLLAVVWVCLFVGFAFWFKGPSMMDEPNATLFGIWQLMQNAKYRNAVSDLTHSMVRMAIFNAIVAGLICWPLHAVIVVLFGLVGGNLQSLPLIR